MSPSCFHVSCSFPFDLKRNWDYISLDIPHTIPMYSSFHFLFHLLVHRYDSPLFRVGFPKIWGTIFSGPHSKDCRIPGSIYRPLTQGNYQFQSQIKPVEGIPEGRSLKATSTSGHPSASNPKPYPKPCRSYLNPKSLARKYVA